MIHIFENMQRCYVVEIKTFSSEIGDDIRFSGPNDNSYTGVKLAPMTI